MGDYLHKYLKYWKKYNLLKDQKKSQIQKGGKGSTFADKVEDVLSDMKNITPFFKKLC